MPARRASQKVFSRASWVAVMAITLATACGRIGYDPELIGVVGPMNDAAADRSNLPTDAADDATSDAGAGGDHETDGSIDSASLDASYETDAPSMKTDARPQDAGACPTGIEFTNPRQTPLHGGSGGTPGSAFCPAGYVLIGIGGVTRTADAVIGSIEMICMRFTFVEAEIACLPVPTSSISLGTFGVLAPGQAWMTSCPAGQVIAGIRGRSGNALDQLAIQCAALTVSNAGGTYSASVGNPTPQPPQGGPGGVPFDDTCPKNTAANGIAFRAGQFIDAFAIYCATVTPLP